MQNHQHYMGAIKTKKIFGEHNMEGGKADEKDG
jgi:hypothetical protein